MDDFPPAFCPDTYRRLHADLGRMSEPNLRDHYQRYGKAEGRQASPVRGRAEFLRLFDARRPALEIGAFDSCLLKPPGVFHFDVLDQAALQARAEKLGRNPSGVPFIDHVSPTGDLSCIDDKFELVISSHAIEHAPDLIAHLRAVGRLLTPTGVYALMIPDCRYCFDHFLPPSSVADVLQASLEARKVHTLASVIEHRALTTHNNPARHWAGDHGPDNRPDIAPEPARVKQAVAEWRNAQGGYVDVHAWQFTPDSFDRLLTLLAAMGEIPLRPVRVYHPVRGSVEFLAILAPEAGGR